MVFMRTLRSPHSRIFPAPAAAGMRLLSVLLPLLWLPAVVCSQDMPNQILRGHEMLNEIKNDIKGHYYDETFHKIDLDARFKAADEQISTAVSGDQIYGVIASTLLALEDSHTFFIPPVWSLDVDYGWEMQMVGDQCYVTSVKPLSDAEAKGLKPGDRVLGLFGVAITRDNLWQLEYLFRGLRPVNPMRIITQSVGGNPKQLDLIPHIEKATFGSIGAQQKLDRISVQYYLDAGDDLFVWKMPNFDLNDKGIGELMGLAGKHKALILDLRGNDGGYEETLLNLLGYFFDHDVKVGDRNGRKESKPIIAKSRRTKAYLGKLMVLVDSRSASAAEIFARVIQLEHRGMVLGDRTGGAVTEARHFYHEYFRRKGFMVSSLGVGYGVSVTINNLIMTDGKSLERLGVRPDELILPTPRQLATKEDPVFARAAEMLGVAVNPKNMNKREFKPLSPTP